MDETVLSRLISLYQQHGTFFRQVKHEPTYTSEEAARARGEDLKIGGKALVMKVNKQFCLFVVPANHKTDSVKIRKHLGSKKLRFASTDELKELTGLVPGSVPPFGEPVLPLALFADERLAQNDRIAFNAGSLTTSHILSMDDYLQLAQPELFDFAIE